MRGLLAAGFYFRGILIEKLGQRLGNEHGCFREQEADKERHENNSDDLACVAECDDYNYREYELEHRHDRCPVTLVSLKVRKFFVFLIHFVFLPFTLTAVRSPSGAAISDPDALKQYHPENYQDNEAKDQSNVDSF